MFHNKSNTLVVSSVLSVALSVSALLISFNAHSKVHHNKRLGVYEFYHHIDDCTGKTLMICMETTLYPSIKKAAAMAGNQGMSGHVSAIAKGIGVELPVTGPPVLPCAKNDVEPPSLLSRPHPTKISAILSTIKIRYFCIFASIKLIKSN